MDVTDYLHTYGLSAHDLAMRIIINLPHHVSKTRPQMSMEERAAQFSPCAALTDSDTVTVSETDSGWL